MGIRLNVDVWRQRKPKPTEEERLRSYESRSHTNENTLDWKLQR